MGSSIYKLQISVCGVLMYVVRQVSRQTVVHAGCFSIEKVTVSIEMQLLRISTEMAAFEVLFSIEKAGRFSGPFQRAVSIEMLRSFSYQA